MGTESDVGSSAGTTGSAAVNYNSKNPVQKLSLRDLGQTPSGQSFDERKRAGRSELAIWIPDAMKASLPKLAQAMGVKHPKEAVERAISEAMERYM